MSRVIEMRACPKPAKRRKRVPKPMQRSPMKARGKRTAKSGGALFPKAKNKAYRDWIRTAFVCFLAGSFVRQRISLHDQPEGSGYAHRCWGDMTPAHVGEHQARGAPDVGRCIPLCAAAHAFYDEHRTEFAAVTGYSEDRLQQLAQELAVIYVGTTFSEADFAQAYQRVGHTERGS